MHLVKKAESIPEDMPFLEFKKLFSETKQHYFPVTASNERFIGIFPAMISEAFFFQRKQSTWS